MQQIDSPSRRNFLKTSGALAVTAFLAEERAWTAETPPPSTSWPVPPLDGELILSGPVLDEAASDFGRFISRQPVAVLRPGSVQDVVKMVRFARIHDIHIGGMGKVGESHSTFGQAQVEAGIVIDMATLNQIHEINGDHAVVDAGVRWVDLVQQAAAVGKTPPTLTDYINLSIGGTLSVGGIGGQTFRSGMMVDNVLELQVVTGRGRLVRCSPTRRRFLFRSVLAGLGQFAVIVRAKVRLRDVPSQTRTYTAIYPTVQSLAADQQTVIQDGRFDYVEGQALFDEQGNKSFLLEAVKYFDPGNPPDDNALLAGLSFIPGTESTLDRSYFDFANRLQPIVDLLIQLGLWQLPHPWFDMFVPGPDAPTFVENVLNDETPATIGPAGVILIYPFLRSSVQTRFVSLPNTETVFLFSLLRTTPPPTDPNDLVQKNRGIFEDLVAIGGKRYPISSVPVSQAEWQDHYGARWPLFALAKLIYDPSRILAPGQGIFS